MLGDIVPEAIRRVGGDIVSTFWNDIDIDALRNPGRVFAAFDWSKLWFFNSNTFTWDKTTTPMANLNAIVFVTVCWITLLAALKVFMAFRKEGLPIQRLIVLHNIILAVWSLVMAVGIFYELALSVMSREGPFSFMDDLICDEHGVLSTGRIYYWEYIFFFSKFYELLDTVILVLRKKDISFLHGFHHLVVMYLFWYFLDQKLSVHWTCAFLNASVHVFMYTYYGFVAARVEMPERLKRSVTTIQIIQFVLDVTSVWPHALKLYGVFGFEKKACSGGEGPFWIGQAIGLTFFGLFTHLYITSYLSKKKERAAARAASGDEKPSTTVKETVMPAASAKTNGVSKAATHRVKSSSGK